jgi:hypothetical protein
MKEQTAVEWLVEQICGDHTEQWQKEIEQAKEMEKEQRGYSEEEVSILSRNI